MTLELVHCGKCVGCQTHDRLLATASANSEEYLKTARALQWTPEADELYYRCLDQLYAKHRERELTLREELRKHHCSAPTAKFLEFQ